MGVLYEEMPLPRKRKRGRNEKLDEMVGAFIFRKDVRGMLEIAFGFPGIFG